MTETHRCPACGLEVTEDEERHRTPSGAECPRTLTEILDDEEAETMLLLLDEDD